MDSSIFQDSEIKGYRIAEVGNYYGNIKQRWLIVESEARRSSDLKQLEKRVGKHLASAQSQLRGFHFLKEPLFFTSSVFLKSSRRVAALAMIMGLCLLVYNLGQRSLRLALKAAETT